MPYHSLKIVQIIQETPDARSFVLEIPPGLAERFQYKAGQFLTFRIVHPQGEVVRCYSLSSSPEADPRPKVTVKRVAGGRGSNWFNDALAEGATIEVMPPAGRFLLVDGGAPILLFAGGSGITPVLSLIKSALTTTQRRVRLFYANRDQASTIFRLELAALLAAHPGRMEVIHHLDAEHGLTTAEKVAAAMADGFDAGAAYLCGPGPFMTLVEDTLLQRGMARERVIVERFEASANAAVPIPDDDEKIVPERITIRLEGKVHTVPYQKGQTVLQAARAAGLSPSSACEEGFCASCAAKRIKGEVLLAANDIYTQEDLDNGWVLTCQAHAFGREVEINYDVV